MRIEPQVGEIPSPSGYELENRVEWLREVMAGTWSDVAASSGEHYRTYRQDIARCVSCLTQDTVVFSHFIAINALIGEAMGDDRVVIRQLDNCSVTIFDLNDGGLEIVELGGEADTLIR